jgi:hypothetical protein
MMDRLEVRAPGVVALAIRFVLRLPRPLRRRVLADAFARAQDAFNRGDFEAVFALFADDVEYVPPPALHNGAPILGRAPVLRFWQVVLERYEHNRIENLSIEEVSPNRFVRTARLSHAGPEPALEYAIRQTTELCGGRVVRQVNE